MTQEETNVPTLDELKAMLKKDHGIDVDALQASAAAPPPQPMQQSDLTAALTAALAANPTLGLAGSDEDRITGDDIVGAVVQLSQQNVQLANGYQEMKKERATEVVDALVGTGHILPKQREFAINLKLTRPADFDEFVPAEPVVAIGDQTGLTVPQDQHETAQQTAELDRIAGQYAEYFGKK